MTGSRRAWFLWDGLCSPDHVRNPLGALIDSRWRKGRAERLVDKLIKALHVREEGGEETLPARPDENDKLWRNLYSLTEAKEPLENRAQTKYKTDFRKLWRNLYHLTKAKEPLECLCGANTKEKALEILSLKLRNALLELKAEFNMWRKLENKKARNELIACIIDLCYDDEDDEDDEDVGVDFGDEYLFFEDVGLKMADWFNKGKELKSFKSWVPNEDQIEKFFGMADKLPMETLDSLLNFARKARGEKAIGSHMDRESKLEALKNFSKGYLKFFRALLHHLAEGTVVKKAVVMQNEQGEAGIHHDIGLTPKESSMASKLWDGVYTSIYKSVSIQTLLREVVIGDWKEARALRLIEKVATALRVQEDGPRQKRLATAEKKVVDLRDRELWSILFQLTEAETPLNILSRKQNASSALVKLVGQALQELKNEFSMWEKLQDKQELKNMWKYVGGAIPKDNDEDRGADAMSEDDEENEEGDDNYTRSVFEDVGLKLQGIFSDNDLQASLKTWEPEETHIEEFLEIARKLPIEKSIYLLDYANYVSNKKESKTPMDTDAVLEELRPVSKVPLRILRALLKWLAEDATPGETVPGDSPQSEQFVPDSPEQSLSYDGEAGVRPSGTVGYRTNSSASDMSGSTITGDQSVMNVETFREQVLSMKKSRDLDEYLDLIFAQESEIAERIFLEICYGSGGPLGMLDICKTLLPKYVEANRLKANRLCDQDKLLETGSCSPKWSSDDCENVKNTARAPKRIEQNQKIETSEKKKKTTRAPRQPKERTNESEKETKVPKELKKPKDSAASQLSEEEIKSIRKFVKFKTFNRDVLVENLAALDPNLDLGGKNLRELYNEWRKQIHKLTLGDNNTTTARRSRRNKNNILLPASLSLSG